MSASSRRRRRSEAKPSPAEAAAASSQGGPGKPAPKGATPEHIEHSFLMKCRGWVDALVIAYVLAMFIRTYDVELFKIPTGSMTPTLVGDNEVVEMDYNGDGEKDLILLNQQVGSSPFRRVLQVFIRKGGHYVEQIWVEDVPLSVVYDLEREARPRHDMILVNKFCYWFSPPKHGDIIVFKVPNRPELNESHDLSKRNPWNPQTPIFIKRCVGLPGDTIQVTPPGITMYQTQDPRHVGVFPGTELHIEAHPAIVNGQRLTTPPVFQRVDHFPYGFSPRNLETLPQGFHVPDNSLFMMGDNSANSTDSRAWGAVPMANIKGKAIFRYWPLKKISFLE